MPSHDPKPGEIWLAYVEFLDHPGIGKVRPAFAKKIMNMPRASPTMTAKPGSLLR